MISMDFNFNNKKNSRIQKKIIQEIFLNICVFYGGLNKNTLLSSCSAFKYTLSILLIIFSEC